MPKTIAIFGSRLRYANRDYMLTVEAFLKIYEKGDSIVSGGCPVGGDLFAEWIAKERKIKIVRIVRDVSGSAFKAVKKPALVVHIPEWSVYGQSAGFVRNGYIARDGDIGLAVARTDRKGGTEDTIRKMKKLGKKVILVDN